MAAPFLSAAKTGKKVCRQVLFGKLMRQPVTVMHMNFLFAFGDFSMCITAPPFGCSAEAAQPVTHLAAHKPCGTPALMQPLQSFAGTQKPDASKALQGLPCLHHITATCRPASHLSVVLPPLRSGDE
jgi:hypothetical protein